MTQQPKKPRRQGPDSSRDHNQPHLAILIDKKPGGGANVHAGIARNGRGTTMCDLTDPVVPVLKMLPEFMLPAKDPNFALYRTNGWRHRYAEAFLELNRGCRHCLDVLYQISKEAGWTEPKGLKS